jgi:hypothetical protein
MSKDKGSKNVKKAPATEGKKSTSITKLAKRAHQKMT